jgi:hypothetical protein
MPVTLPQGRFSLATRPSLTGSVADAERDRDRCGRGLGCGCRFEPARCVDDGHLALNEVHRQCWQPIGLILRPVILNQNITTFDVERMIATAVSCGERS